jgi:hypothetical protein
MGAGGSEWLAKHMFLYGCSYAACLRHCMTCVQHAVSVGVEAWCSMLHRVEAGASCAECSVWCCVSKLVRPVRPVTTPHAASGASRCGRCHMSSLVRAWCTECQLDRQVEPSCYKTNLDCCCGNF